MKKLKFYQLKSNKKTILLLMSCFFLFSCNKLKEDLNNRNIEISLLKKDKIDHNSLMTTLLFKNNSDQNYALSIFPEYYLVKTKKGLIYSDDVGKIRGKIVSSAFADEIEDWEKGNRILFSFCKKTLFNYKNSENDFSNFLNSRDDLFSNYVLFLPKKSERRIIIFFNSNKMNDKTFNEENARISADWEFYEPRAKVLDSLLKKERVDYKVYDRDLILKDSLFINK
ncbi:hypothetical protein LF887_08625 [Chryseobacterium sp. MEBOG06]|uniref:hypothetical protein n=1 Tax=unclassified Chryseobacterium TaxID=2593645 RepID=UPI001F328C1E|nr:MULTISPECIES: hypothetical protein [unclassified Chryseobacterium]UKB85671.1 hypothetical protein LF887_08625 [Chryseobacterium sp. MEBOG06]